MGKKKRNADLGFRRSSNNVKENDLIKIECVRSFTAFLKGNHTKALKLVTELCSKHGDSALVHVARVEILLRVASIIDDPEAKQVHLKNALEAAKIAVKLSPNSIGISNWYACVAYGMASEKRDYEEIVEECKRALAVEKPVDPGEDSVLEENHHPNLTAEARIANVQNNLRTFVQMSNIASVSTWMHDQRNEEYKFGLVPIRRGEKDRARVRNEIKKATKTTEERRKEIVVRVAAPRVKQNKSKCPDVKDDMDSSNNNNSNKELDRSSPGSIQIPRERRKTDNARKNMYPGERMDRVRSYWNSMSSAMKKDFLRIKILDLKAHFSASKDGLSEMLNEALSFCQANKVWKFWMCYRCDEQFADFGSLMRHVKFEHLERYESKMKLSPPHIVEHEWAEMLRSCQWKPLELNNANMILKEKSKPETPDFFNSCTKKKLLQEDWPLSDDPERAMLLEAIHAVLEVLTINKYLESSHLSKVMQYAVAALQGLEGGPQLLNSNVDKTPLCICFLGARELNKILRYLEEISHACGISRCPDEINVTDETKAGVQRVGIIGRVTFSHDCSFLVLDEHFLPRETPRSSCNDAVSGDSSSATSSHIIYKNGVVLDSDALLSWIFTSPSTGEQLETWRRMREEKTEQGLETLQLLEKNLDCLNDSCDLKYENLRDKEALRTVEDLCFRIKKKRKDAMNFVCQNYETVLHDRREELIETEDPIDSNREFVAINKVLNDAEIVIKSQVCPPESGEIDNCRTNDYLQQVNSSIEVAIQRQKEQVSIELGKNDATIIAIIQDMEQLKDKLKAASSHEYESIIIHLVKSFLQACLEDLAEKDSTQRFDATKNAILAESSLNSKKSVSAAVDHSEHVHKSTKTAKKSKENRKNKDLKVTNGDESHAQIESVKKILLPYVCSEEGPLSRIAVRHTDEDAVLLQDEEYKHFIEQSMKLRK